ncbi:MAG: hypothetical protein H0W12_06625 [Chitinophagaceae bacterium]|nr:hypothetical protein [Chitinophagaceae bacterium]
MSLTKITILLFSLVIIFCSCKKDSFITSKQAGFSVSADTLTFDTVFTTTGSITRSFKIFNPNEQKLRISKIKLSGGQASAFKLNIDGTSASEADNVDIAANDSLYVFVQVNVNPSAANLPFVIRDSILISYNGNDRYVQLQAYGQNANFLRNIKLSGNTVWNNNLPYVILGGLQLDVNATLTIQAGSKIYFHADAPLLVNGSLIINGTKPAPVILTGDRLDPDYKNLPASWPGIYFLSASKDNVLKFAVIKNAYQAIVVQDASVNANPKLKISQTVIDNSYDAGILAFNTSIQADNCLISNCGSNLILAAGGNYQFTHCTVASYNNFIDHTIPVLQVANFATQNNQTITANLSAVFTNSIFWGESGLVDDEVVVSKQGNTIFNVTFDHDLYKVAHDPANITAIAVIKNEDPMFDSINTSKQYFDFHFNLKPFSPAIDKGIATIFPKDLDNRPRANGLPDLGCYEK